MLTFWLRHTFIQGMMPGFTGSRPAHHGRGAAGGMTTGPPPGTQRPGASTA